MGDTNIADDGLLCECQNIGVLLNSESATYIATHDQSVVVQPFLVEAQIVQRDTGSKPYGAIFVTEIKATISRIDKAPEGEVFTGAATAVAEAMELHYSPYAAEFPPDSAFRDQDFRRKCFVDFVGDMNVETSWLQLMILKPFMELLQCPVRDHDTGLYVSRISCLQPESFKAKYTYAGYKKDSRFDVLESRVDEEMRKLQLRLHGIGLIIAEPPSDSVMWAPLIDACPHAGYRHPVLSARGGPFAENRFLFSVPDEYATKYVANEDAWFSKAAMDQEYNNANALHRRQIWDMFDGWCCFYAQQCLEMGWTYDDVISLRSRFFELLLEQNVTKMVVAKLFVRSFTYLMASVSVGDWKRVLGLGNPAT